MHDCAHHPSTPPGPPPSVESIEAPTAQAFQALGRVLHLQRQALQRGLSSPRAHHGEMISLRLLASNDGISQRDLADILHLSRPRVTNILQALQKAGSVRREPDAADQRVTRVFLTDEGRRQETQNRAGFEHYIRETIGRLSDADKLELARILNELSGHIAEALCAGASERNASEREGQDS